MHNPLIRYIFNAGYFLDLAIYIINIYIHTNIYMVIIFYDDRI